LSIPIPALPHPFGDPVALIGVLDYVAQQAVGVGFFDMLQGLKLAD